MNLSEHFSLEELIISNTAVRAGIDNTPSEYVLANLARLAAGLELVRAALGSRPIHVTSGYRCPALNALVGGVLTSRHIFGLAADIICAEFGTPLEVCNAIAGAHIAFDQVIHEYGRWCHVAFADFGKKPRAELLTIRPGSTAYETGLLNV